MQLWLLVNNTLDLIVKKIPPSSDFLCQSIVSRKPGVERQDERLPGCSTTKHLPSHLKDQDQGHRNTHDQQATAARHKLLANHLLH